MSEITHILSAIEQGDPSAAEQLLPLVYDELRKLATAKLVHERPGQTLQATALVHEAYLRLVDVDQEQHWDGRRHFFAAAAQAMHRILIENARRKSRHKHGGGRKRVDLNDLHPDRSPSPDSLVALDDALNKLLAEDPAAGRLVQLRYFAGRSIEQAADSLQISRSSAYEHWAYARAWLCCELDPGSNESPS